MSKYIETTFANTKKEILKFPDHYVAMAVTIDDEGIEPNEDGKKIVPAGTIVGGKENPVLENLDELVEKKNSGNNADKAEGVLFNDVDVTYGPAGGSMLVHGFLAIDKLPEAPAADAIAALKQITFIK
jgi:hypothetical protein